MQRGGAVRGVRLNAVWALVGLSAGACMPVTIPNEPPDVEGIIAGVGESVPFEGLNFPGQIWIITSPEDECGTLTSVDERGEIVIRDADGDLHRGDMDDVRIGVAARLWYLGNVANSCPGGGRARVLELMPLRGRHRNGLSARRSRTGEKGGRVGSLPESRVVDGGYCSGAG